MLRIKVVRTTKLIIFGLTIIGLSACSSNPREYSPAKHPKSQFASVTSIVPSPIPNDAGMTILPTSSPALQIPTETHLPTVTVIVQPTSTVSVQKMVPDELQEYIGSHYPPLPDGFVEGFGMLIVPSNGLDYSLSGIHKNDMHMLWLGKKVRWKSDGMWYRGWETLDILLLPSLTEENERLIPGGCKIRDEIDPEIIVVALLDEEASNTRYIRNEKILRAWRVNRSVEAFEEIPTDHIECFGDLAMRW